MRLKEFNVNSKTSAAVIAHYPDCEWNEAVLTAFT
jgi:hypothetical protein